MIKYIRIGKGVIMENLTRRQKRVLVMQKLYYLDLFNCSLQDVINTVFDDQQNMDSETIEFIADVYNKRAEIDALISKSLTNYSLERLNLVDRAIIELATYEMLSGVVPAVAINEAIEITKEYSDTGDKKAVSFNNSLLDRIKNNLK